MLKSLKNFNTGTECYEIKLYAQKQPKQFLYFYYYFVEILVIRGKICTHLEIYRWFVTL